MTDRWDAYRELMLTHIDKIRAHLLLMRASPAFRGWDWMRDGDNRALQAIRQELLDLLIDVDDTMAAIAKGETGRIEADHRIDAVLETAHEEFRKAAYER